MSLAALPVSLAVLASQINDEVAAAEKAAVSVVEHARRAGELLIQAKAQLAHGEWLPWLRENCPAAERTAQVYMQVARRLASGESLPAHKSAAAADLPLRGVLHLLGQESLQDRPPESNSEPASVPVLEACREEVATLSRPAEPQRAQPGRASNKEYERYYTILSTTEFAIRLGLEELEPAKLEPAELAPVVEALRLLLDALWARPWRGAEARSEAHYKRCLSNLVQYFEEMRDRGGADRSNSLYARTKGG